MSLSFSSPIATYGNSLGEVNTSLLSSTTIKMACSRAVSLSAGSTCYCLLIADHKLHSSAFTPRSSKTNYLTTNRVWLWLWVSGLWLRAPPSSNIGTLSDDNTFHFTASLWLGAPHQQPLTPRRRSWSAGAPSEHLQYLSTHKYSIKSMALCLSTGWVSMYIPRCFPLLTYMSMTRWLILKRIKLATSSLNYQAKCSS